MLEIAASRSTAAPVSPSPTTGNFVVLLCSSIVDGACPSSEFAALRRGEPRLDGSPTWSEVAVAF